MPIVCLDCGNTRMKWGVWLRGWREQGSLNYSDTQTLAELGSRWKTPSRILLAQVATESRALRIEECIPHWQNRIEKIHAEAAACGVINGYNTPEKLGADRWCALIGAWGRTRKACVVVMCGTATTIDTLREDGVFLGGMIMPGLGLMPRALARETAKLSFGKGDYDLLPKATNDAIVTGSIEAHLGAICRAFMRLKEKSPHARLLISGGNSRFLSKFVDFPHQQIDNLPLEGLRRIAFEKKMAFTVENH